MLRVLFVDDDEMFLASLEARLMAQRAPWDMVFASGADEATMELARGSFDVVVSDMTMPGTDGKALLERVREFAPRTGRVIMTGADDLDDAARFSDVAHQMVSKSQKVGFLEAAVEAARRLSHVEASDPRLAIGRIEHLPTPPALYADLCRALGEARADLRGPAKVIARDPALGAQILKVVNSAYFGLRKPTTDIARAVACLGQTLLRGMVLRYEVERAALGLSPQVRSLVEQLNAHSLSVAELASEMVPPSERADAYTAGLLHDVGKLVLAREDCDALLSVAETARRLDASESCVERMRWGLSHAEVGGALLDLWGLPGVLYDAVVSHHEPLARYRRHRTLADVVALANRIAEEAEKTRSPVSVAKARGAGSDDDVWAFWVAELDGPEGE